MGDIIHLLPDSIANQIAAGEVIQRPASAIKELMENAVDAGATEIKVVVKEAGKMLIQVIDNGKGMSFTDARMCFERHATSKIRSADDIFSIRTKGFRGEALASIAAIAQVELKTRQQEHELGARLVIEGFEVKAHEQAQCPVGTNIQVKNLFYNVPARRNFLKSNTVELKHIIDEFERVVLAHPDIFFSLQHNGVELFHLKAGNLRQRIIHLFGSNYNEKLVPISEDTSVTNIRGFIGKPDAAKKTKGEQFFFVNNRFIRSPYLHHAVMSAYQELLPEGSYPLYTIYIDIDPARIDVNVHPTKQEIKFEDERIIYTFIQAAVRHALAQYSVTPTLDFEQDQTFANLPSFYKKPEEQPVSFKTVESRMNDIPQHQSSFKHDVASTNRMHTAFKREVSGALHDDEVQSDMPTDGATPFQIHYQYVVTQIKSGFIVIDQQAAHERILYEKYVTQLREKKHHSQQQLFPETLKLSGADFALMEMLLPDLQNLGFDIMPFGKDAFVVHGIPVEFENGDINGVVEALLEQFKEDKSTLKLDRHEAIARSLARTNSIKRGQKLDERGMRHLADQLFACETPYTSPFGNLTFVTFTLEALARQFQKSN
ncbi:MAG TPA: DNA mismatch repair endonuclease MutL [Chitinophagales bacterium]|nr:DNA mismatch repair endonuclease MutL [Chitinophagales bacterium]HMZ89422.1 DNA mismatch repair endonuclease MutL [Chitinophagales bacterium]HNA56536.1 DNA mismatch repair endonuclease MutL [Chitinophagales bacterium]HNE45109.1 DNA mismatch repair endonuclease MutL [Chitinophagales bacterium]HNF68765.1 DNA mismatch repair endonuclease MutL [Chitinophagales bacterium]